MTRTALVTGGASGIGRALVDLLAERGDDVVVLDSDEAAGAELAHSGAARFVAGDVSDPAAWRALAEELDRLDAAFFNAGVAGSASPFLDVDWAAVQHSLDVNVGGVLQGVRTLAPVLERSGGAIVVTASLVALEPLTTDPVYTLGKAAVVGFVRAAGPSLAARGVRLAAVCPSLTGTRYLDTPVGRLMQAAGFRFLEEGEVAAALLRASLEAEPGAIWSLRPETGLVPVEFPRPA